MQKLTLRENGCPYYSPSAKKFCGYPANHRYSHGGGIVTSNVDDWIILPNVEVKIEEKKEKPKWMKELQQH